MGGGGGGGEARLVLYQNKMHYNLETLECNRKKFGTQPET